MNNRRITFKCFLQEIKFQMFFGKIFQPHELENKENLSGTLSLLFFVLCLNDVKAGSNVLHERQLVALCFFFVKRLHKVYLLRWQIHFSPISTHYPVICPWKGKDGGNLFIVWLFFSVKTLSKKSRKSLKGPPYYV